MKAKIREAWARVACVAIGVTMPARRALFPSIHPNVSTEDRKIISVLGWLLLLLLALVTGGVVIIALGLVGVI